nr:aminopeptidase P family N-terminal domain-containing protein [Mesorhizobium sp.]
MITEPANIYYLRGYDAWSFYTVQALVVFQDVELPLWIGRLVDSATAHITCYLPVDRIIPYPDVYVQAADRHASQFIADEFFESRRARKQWELRWGLTTIRIETT